MERRCRVGPAWMWAPGREEGWVGVVRRELWDGPADARASVGVLFYAVAMANGPDLDTQTLDDFNISFAFTITKSWRSPFSEAHVSYKSCAVVLIRQVRPNNVVEDVVLEGFNGERQAC
jgi:hypothetical protein